MSFAAILGDTSVVPPYHPKVSWPAFHTIRSCLSGIPQTAHGAASLLYSVLNAMQCNSPLDVWALALPQALALDAPPTADPCRPNPRMLTPAGNVRPEG